MASGENGVRTEIVLRLASQVTAGCSGCSFATKIFKNPRHIIQFTDMGLLSSIILNQALKVGQLVTLGFLHIFIKATCKDRLINRHVPMHYAKVVMGRRQ